MCFSSTASFAGGALISSIGAATLYENRKPSQWLFASIPIVFGIQQISEGFVWFSLQMPGHNTMLKVSIYTFLAMALLVWPTMMPLSLLLMERSKKNRKMLYAFLAVGIAVSLYYLAEMLMFKVTAQIISHHILYNIGGPKQLAATIIFYLIATIPPLFVSSNKKVYLLGILIAISYLVTYIFFTEFLVSVWCFFAALASVVILWIVSPQNGRDRHN